MNLPNQVNIALTQLNENGFEAFLVGGCVRDALIHVKQKDFDITTNARPEEMLNIFKNFKVIETGLKHGTITVIIESLPIEITTYRIDGTYLDHRRPENVEFTNRLKDDVSRRDFTINSICYHPQTGFVDYFNGQEDINNKIIKTVGEPKERFKEDALRMLRALRFSAVLGFEIEEKTKLAIIENKNLLLKISMERIAQEFMKILMAPYSKQILHEYSSIIAAFLPEIIPSIGFAQQTKYHCYDVYDHSVEAVTAVKNTKVLKLSAFFHDIGKPNTFSLDEFGNGHFYNHTKESVTITQIILKRLKFDNNTLEQVLQLITYHDVSCASNEKSIKRWLNKVTPEVFLNLLELQKADCLAQSPNYRYRLEEIKKVKQIALEIMEKGSPFSIKDLSINGKDLMSMGFIQGNEIGKILNDLLELVIEEKVSNDKDILISYVKNKWII